MSRRGWPKGKSNPPTHGPRLARNASKSDQLSSASTPSMRRTPASSPGASARDGLAPARGAGKVDSVDPHRRLPRPRSRAQSAGPRRERRLTVALAAEALQELLPGQQVRPQPALVLDIHAEVPEAEASRLEDPAEASELDAAGPAPAVEAREARVDGAAAVAHLARDELAPVVHLDRVGADADEEGPRAATRATRRARRPASARPGRPRRRPRGSPGSRGRSRARGPSRGGRCSPTCAGRRSRGRSSPRDT